MSKISTFMMLVALIGLIGLGVTESYAKDPAASEAARPYQVSQLYGSYVKNPQGEYLGRVEDFVIEKDRIAYLILVHGGFVGMGGKLVAVPYEACSFDHKGPGFVVNVSRDKLRFAPDFFRSTDLTSRKWAEESYRFFGLQPYWTDEEQGKEEHSSIREQMKPAEQEEAGTTMGEAKRLFYGYESNWPTL